MGKRVLVGAALVAMFTLISTASFAHQGECGGSKGNYGRSEDKITEKTHVILKNKDELGLSDEQEKKITDLMLKSKKALIKQNADIEIIGLDIKAKMMEDVVNTKEINPLIDKKFDLKKAKAKSSMATCAALKSILTEEQEDKLKELHRGQRTEKKGLHRKESREKGSHH